MKSIDALMIAAGILVLSPALVLADDASKNAKIEEMLRLTHSDQMLTQILDQMKSTVTAQLNTMNVPADARPKAEEMQQKMMALIADRLSWEKAKPALIKVYSDTFTESEIDGIVAFYKSPPGQAMLEKMPQLMQKSMAVGQQLMGDVMPEIQRMKEEMKQQESNPTPK